MKTWNSLLYLTIAFSDLISNILFKLRKKHFKVLHIIMYLGILRLKDQSISFRKWLTFYIPQRTYSNSKNNYK